MFKLLCFLSQLVLHNCHKVCYNRSIRAVIVLPENTPSNALFGGFFLFKEKIEMTTTSTSEHHDCAHSQCQHVVAYSDERYCYMHEPPVFDDHNCVVLNCAHWKTGKTFRPLEQPVAVAAGPSYSEQVLADAKAEAAKLADDWDWPLPNDDF